MDESTYHDRLRIPACGHCDLALYSGEGLLLARGYQRVVCGPGGPYVELLPSHVVREHFRMEDHPYRPGLRTVYGIAFRSTCPSQVRAYFQKRPVNHAGLLPGRWYISAADLCVAGGQRALAPPQARQMLLPGGGA